MTYEDWCKAHRKTLKKMAKDTVTSRESGERNQKQSIESAGYR